jgi:hypothetical protein
MKCLATLSNTMKSKAVLATAIMVIALCANAPRTYAAKPSATPSPFAGTYCGYLVGQNYGSLSISESGGVSGYFSFQFPSFSESYKLSGRVSTTGEMRLKVVHSITVRDRRSGTRTERYSVTVNVALDENGNLVATSGASFVLSPCP